MTEGGQAPGVYAGVDVAAATLVVTVLDARGQPLAPARTVANTPAGWTTLRQWLERQRARAGGGPGICGLEATGAFHRGVAAALAAAGWAVRVLNPRAVKAFGQARLQPAKTDRLDSALLADYVRCVRPPARPGLDPAVEQLRRLTRQRRRLVEARTAALNTLRAHLRECSPGGGPRRLGPRRVAALAAEGLRALGPTPAPTALPEVADYLVRQAARAVQTQTAELQALERVLRAVGQRCFPAEVLAALTSIPGVGFLSAVTILAEVGDFQRFPSARAFVGYCGLYPTVWQSGRRERRGRLTRQGNRMLKLTFLLAAVSARVHNPVLAAFAARLRAQGKGPRAIGGAVARKLAVYVYTLGSRRQRWAPARAARPEDPPRLTGVAAPPPLPAVSRSREIPLPLLSPPAPPSQPPLPAPDP